jgi:DNA repair photolyase
MYDWVTHTWNVIRGHCQHECIYCSVKFFHDKPLHFVDKELSTNLGQGNMIFVGSSTDMWADNVPAIWISKVLKHCQQFDNTYLFQSKNPERFLGFAGLIPQKVVFGTTIESNYSRFMNFMTKNGTVINNFQPSNATSPTDRAEAMAYLQGFDTMVTIEPIMKFNHDIMVRLVKQCSPKWVNIGADSKGHNLPEPTWQEVQQLAAELKTFTEVKLKDNLLRLKKGDK